LPGPVLVAPDRCRPARSSDPRTRACRATWARRRPPIPQGGGAARWWSSHPASSRPVGPWGLRCRADARARARRRGHGDLRYRLARRTVKAGEGVVHPVTPGADADAAGV